MPFGGLLTAGVLAGGAYLSGRKKDKAAKDQANLNNQHLEAQRQAQQQILAGLESSGWNPYGVNSLQSGSSGTSNTSGSESSYSKENPFTTAEYGKLDNLVRGVMENRLSRGSSLPPGYEQNAIRKANEAFASTDATARNIAARKGLSGAQVFGLNSPAQAARAGKIADIRGSVPLLERDLMDKDMAMEADRQSRFGTGRETRGTRRYSSSTDSSQSGFNQQGPNIGGLASLLMPPGAQQSTMSPNSGLGSALTAGGAAFANYNANQQAAGGGITGGVPPIGFCPDGQYRPGC